MIKKGSTPYIVPGCMTLKPRRARYMSFSLQTANTKCIGPDLPVKWAVPNLAMFNHAVVLNGFVPGLF